MDGGVGDKFDQNFSQEEHGERERTDGLLFASSVETAGAETEK